MSYKCIRPEGAMQSNRNEEFGLPLQDESNLYIAPRALPPANVATTFQAISTRELRTTASAFPPAPVDALGSCPKDPEELPQLDTRFGQGLV